MPNVKPLSDQLRAIVESSGLTRYRIAQETGIAESVLSRFMGGGGLNLETLDRLGSLFGITLKARGAPKSALNKPRR